ncbi:MAG: ATPase, T2SS/T4P/T4SS family, partial [Planctomycetaceae bacterium]
VVMRLLDKTQATISLDAIEFPAAMRNAWDRLIRRSHGMVLVTGPTGSGKTTTLYSSLVEVRSPGRKIITVEEPIEYNLSGISQIQVQNQIGLSFAAGLRSILRHDPDVVLIGEIRDAETAVSAVQASLTGHLVLSTLHTNDAASAFTRLVDMGIEPYLVASTIEGVLAQRLVRRLCADCREMYEPQVDELPEEMRYETGMRLYRAVGCRACHQTGYSGRVAMFELLAADRTMRDLCIQQAPSSELREHALRNGMTPLMQSGCELVRQGTTSIDEVLRVCSDGDE